LRFGGGNFNLFVYCYNSPISITDPSGKQGFTIIISLLNKIAIEYVQAKFQEKFIDNERDKILKKVQIAYDLHNHLYDIRNECHEYCQERYHNLNGCFDISGCLRDCTEKYLSDCEKLLDPLEMEISNIPIFMWEFTGASKYVIVQQWSKKYSSGLYKMLYE